MYDRTNFQVSRTISLLVALVASGCQRPPDRPEFLARSEQDCARGDQSACSMVDALRPSLVKAGPQSRIEASQAQITRDVAAIVHGIERARSYLPIAEIEIAPTSPPERLPIR
jgi:hypothetical protein